MKVTHTYIHLTDADANALAAQDGADRGERAAARVRAQRGVRQRLERLVGHGATAMLYRTLVRDADQYSPLFIGCPEVFVAKSEEAALEKQLLALRCVPVFLEPPVAHRYFQGFCKGVLWPVFHNVVDVYNSAELQLDCEENKKKKRDHSWFGGGKKEENSGVKSAWCDPVSWNPAAQDMCWSDYCSVNR